MKPAKRLNQDLPAPAKPLPRLFLLTLLKESYLLIANSYGFLVHPYLTLRRLRRDRSQLAIFASLWAGASLGLLFLLLLLLLIPYFFPQLRQLARWGAGATLMVATLLLFFTLYLSYWFFIIQKEK